MDTGTLNYSMNIQSLTEQFRQAMQEAGIAYSGEIIADGKFHRFHIEGHKLSSKNGVYILHANTFPAGYFKDHRSGIEEHWRYKDAITHANGFKYKVKESIKWDKIEQHNRHEAAAAKAVHKWKCALPISNQNEHPYLINKKIQPNGSRLMDRFLVIPVHDQSDRLVSLQTISLTGEKRFLSGGRKQGCFYRLGEVADTLLICEGFATGASLYETSGKQVIIAFDAGNLLPVAEYFRRSNPRADIIICGDNDLSGVGQEKATKAALAIYGKVLIPPIEGMDWNDYLTMGEKK